MCQQNVFMPLRFLPPVKPNCLRYAFALYPLSFAYSIFLLKTHTAYYYKAITFYTFGISL